MLLRRITQHVKAQNWFAVGLDFLIVVTGVFIGLQVSNWNDTRRSQLQARDLTERLVEDLRNEAFVAQAVIRYNEDVLGNAERTLAALEGDSESTNLELLISAFRASQYYESPTRRATYDALIATGRIGLIEDLDLLATANWHYNALYFEQIKILAQRSRYRELYREITPTAVHREIRLQCGDPADGLANGDYGALVQLLNYDCAPGLEISTVDAAAAALRATADLIPALRLRIATLETQIADVKVQVDGSELDHYAETEDSK